nr:iron chelate uptake ABC transporter family permease subunit [Brachybacterium sacelli]
MLTAGLLIGLLSSVVLSLAVGARPLSVAEILNVLRDHGSAEATALLWDYRLPRTLVALLVGAALAVAGGLIQAFTRNPLADPGILGVNAGAAFAVTVAIAALGVVDTSGLIVAALLGAAVASLAVVAIGAGGRGPATPLRTTLAGVALAAVLGGVTSGLRLLDPGTFDRFRVWAAGSVAGPDLAQLVSVAPWIGIGLLIALGVTRPLNAIALGEDLAGSLGVRLAPARVLAVGAVTLLAGAATAIAGPISFLGLMVPHAVRWTVGPDQRRILPLSVLGGALLLLVSDVLARVVLPGRELPVGVVTAFVGAPVLVLLVRRRRVSGL